MKEYAAYFEPDGSTTVERADAGVKSKVPRPMYDLVIIRPFEKQEKIGSLWLPEPVAEDVGARVNRGTVIRVGPGRRHPSTGIFMPHEVFPGDVVIYNRGLIMGEADLGEEGLVLVAESDILAVIHDEN